MFQLISIYFFLSHFVSLVKLIIEQKEKTMKRADIIDLIRYHSEQDNIGFNSKAAQIAQEFDSIGENELAGYIMSLISETRSFVPQVFEDEHSFLKLVPPSSTPLPMPECIANDIRGIVNAISRNIKINTILFQGPPGTGKTESAKQIARILDRQLYAADFNTVIDSHLGKTAKNISALFQEVNRTGNTAIVLFDEIDALALDRINTSDVREMGRATSAFLKELDSLNEESVIIATTNLYKQLDPALTRRFSITVDFGRYSKSDLEEVGLSLVSTYAKQFDFINKDTRTVKKIFHAAEHLPYPGELSNIIKTCIVFSDPNNPTDYLPRLYESLNPGKELTPKSLSAQGFTLREMELLTGISRSTLSRTLKEVGNE